MEMEMIWSESGEGFEMERVGGIQVGCHRDDVNELEDPVVSTNVTS